MNEKITLRNILFFLIVIICTIAATSIFYETRIHNISAEYEKRLETIEAANSELRDLNIRLTENNRLAADLTGRGQLIIEEFKRELGNSYDTVGRIEKGLSALEQLISIFDKEE